MKKLIVICVFGFFICISPIDFIHAMPSENRLESTLKAGTAKVEITPRFGQWSSANIVTPLYARALVLKNGITTVALVSCDLALITKELCVPIHRQITEKTGIPAANIMISGSHNHSGPFYLPGEGATYRHRLRDYKGSPDDVAYLAFLQQKFAQAVYDAWNNLIPAEIGVGKGYEDTIGIYSRRRLKDGNISWFSPKKEQGPPAGPYDPEVQTLLIKAIDGAVIATVFNYTCHPNCHAGRVGISGDYVGFACKTIEEEISGTALFTLGAAGNIHPTRYGMAEEMAKPLTTEVIRVARGIKMSENVEIKSIKKEIVLPARDFNTFDTRLITTISNQAPESRKKLRESEWLKELDLLKKEDRKSITTLVQVLMIGDALLVGIPGEFFVELGMQIKWKSGHENPFIVSCTNDHIGYIPTRIAYKEGGYQTLQRALVAPGGGEQIVQEVLNLLAEIEK